VLGGMAMIHPAIPQKINMTRLSLCISLSLCLTPLAFAADKNACTGDPNQWTQIFDGKDLTGWKHVGPGNMTV
jgi:hypothetical protein